MYVRRREGMKNVDIMCSRLKRVQLRESKKYVFRGIKKGQERKVYACHVLVYYL